MKTGPSAQAAQSLLDELESSCLEVILIPQRIHTNEGGCVRVAISKNVQWYRAFCAAYPSARKKPRRRALPDTLIKRAQVVATLRAMVAGRYLESVYARRLAPLVECAVFRFVNQTASNPF